MDILERQENEGLCLKFAPVYSLPDWLDLPQLDRAQLILVAEGLKNGIIIEGNFTSFKKILLELEVEACLNTDSGLLRPAYVVAKPKALSDFFKDILSVRENGDGTVFHKIVGGFLDYPDCCIEEYCNPQKNLEERKKVSPTRFLANIDYELIKEIESTGRYPIEFDYCPPSFTPCSLYCESASKILKQWMVIMEAADPVAARSLQISNWYDSPRMRVHETEFKKYQAEFYLSWQIEQLRRSIQDNE